jgi:hypothetical protein
MAIRSDVTRERKPVIYYPPTAPEIQTFSRSVCQKLAGEISSEFDTPEVKHELAGFVNVVASIWSKELSKKPEILDTEPTQE